MNGAWLHLAVVHLIPWFCLLAGALALCERWQNSETLFRIAAGFGLLAALAAAAAYFSGPEADGVLRGLALDDPQAHKLVEDHALWGRGLFILLGVMGGFSLMCLLQYLQEERPALWQRRLLAASYLAVVPLLAWTSHMGGLIRHTEIRGFF